MGSRVSGKWLTRTVGVPGGSLASRRSVACDARVAPGFPARVGIGVQHGLVGADDAASRTPGQEPPPWWPCPPGGTCSRRAVNSGTMTTGPPAPRHTGNGSSGVSTPSRRHIDTRYRYLASPRSWTGSVLSAHSSWLPGTQTTVANRALSVRSAHSMSAAFSATSPATSSQSRGDAGRRPATNSRFSGKVTCRSLTASSRPGGSPLSRPPRGLSRQPRADPPAPAGGHHLRLLCLRRRWLPLL